MDRLKFSFGFVMLALALYFARPLLPSVFYLVSLGFVLIAFAIYLLWKMFPSTENRVLKLLVLVFVALLAYAGVVHVYQAVEHAQIDKTEHKLEWRKVTTADELASVLKNHVRQNVVIDVYADWCVACQPIEKEVLPQEDVQAKLDNVVRIKLDLTNDHESHDELLKKWQILGPPTFIFLNQEHNELRQLRLTGTFNAAQLMHQLDAMKAEGKP